MTRLLFFFFAAFVCVQNLSAQSTIFLVRHAEKADNDAKDPDLSDAGRARAEALAKILKDAKITAIYATEFKRTQETAQPIARALHINIMTVPAKETTSLVAGLFEQTEPRGNVLVVGHSNTLPEIAKALGVPDSITIGDNDYNDLFLVTATTPPKLLHLHYD